MYVHIMYYQNQGLQGQRQEYILILTHFTSDEIISLLTQAKNYALLLSVFTCGHE